MATAKSERAEWYARMHYCSAVRHGDGRAALKFRTIRKLRRRASMQKPLEIVPAKKAEYVRTRTDKYFTKSREIVEKFGDKTVTYGAFMRRRVSCAANPAIEVLRDYYPSDATPLKITRLYEEGAVVPDNKPIVIYTGSLASLLELETLILQRLGVACVSAYNAYKMAMNLPKTAFID